MEQATIQLSQCMIVKNEEKNIEKALSWGKDLMCEQIVVDTGSTDRTVEMAKKMGAKVFHYAWHDDFAAAKNYAIEQAKGNWIAFLDADEFFSEEDTKKLIPLLERADRNPQIALIRTKIAHLNEDGAVIAVSSQDRLFRNAPDIRYRYRIHEQLQTFGDTRTKYFDAQDELMVLHTGYGSQVNRPEKGKRNVRLLEQELERYPDSGMLLMYLADAYDMANRTEEALDCYRKVVWDDSLDTRDSTCRLRCGLQVLRMRVNEPIKDIEEELFKISDKLKELGYGLHPDIDYFKGLWHLRADQADVAAMFFENALEKLELYHDAETMMTSDLELINRVIAMVALRKGDLQKAVRFVVAALRSNRYSTYSIQILLTAFRIEWRADKSVESYWGFLEKIYDMGNVKDLLTLYKAALVVPFEKLAERICEALPQEVKERLGKSEGSEHDKQGLCATTGTDCATTGEPSV